VLLVVEAFAEAKIKESNVFMKGGRGMSERLTNCHARGGEGDRGGPP